MRAFIKNTEIPFVVNDEQDIEGLRDMLLATGDIKKREDLYIPEEEINAKKSTELKRKIDNDLCSHDIDTREQIVVTANGLQVALIGVSMLAKACHMSSDKNLKKAVEPLMPFADSFLTARESGDMPVDVLGIEKVSEKIIKTSITSGKIVKRAMLSG